MKSYLKFLSRNKAYTAIDVFGLAVSMMFVVLIGCYAWQEWHIDRQHAKAHRMYYLGYDKDGNKRLGGHWCAQKFLKDKFTELESSTAIVRDELWMEYEGEHNVTNCLFVDSTFYDIFDFKLIRGDCNTVLDSPSAAVVTEEYARRVFGEQDPIGQSLIMGNNIPPVVVTGVMEPMTNTAFMTRSNKPVDMLINFSMMMYDDFTCVLPEYSHSKRADILLLAKDGHDLTTRKKEYENALKDGFWIFKTPDDSVSLEIIPFDGSYFSEITSAYCNMNHGNSKMLRLLFSEGLVILLFAIMNYINLTVALAGKRAKEMATRRLLGESRMHVLLRLIGESTLLCSVGMMLGIALAFAMARHASALLQTPLDIAGCLNFTTIGFLVVVLMIMSITSGMIPALMLSSMEPIQAVRGTFSRKSKMVYGKVFIVVQNVATITMLASAITMYTQVRHMVDAPLGYDYDHLMNLYRSHDLDEKGEVLREELLKLTCVDKVSFSSGVPFDMGNSDTIQIDGRTIRYQSFFVDSAYMDILGIKLKKDNHLSKWGWKFYLSVSALESRGIEDDALDFLYDGGVRFPLSGVFDDFQMGTILTGKSPLIMLEMKPFENFSPRNILIKVNGDEAQALAQVKDVFGRIFDSNYMSIAFEVPYMRQQIERSFEKWLRESKIIAVFAVIAMIISMLGLTAMSAYYVQEREQDIAVRKVMGGTSGEVMVMLVRTFMLYVLISAVISVPVIYYVMNDRLSQFSYRIEVYWWIYAVSVLLAIVICLVSVAAQCSRAANSNPVNSLK